MTDKPIIFSGPMVRALLDGRKTQTRRALKPPYGVLEYLPDGTWKPVLPGFAIGDRLWVRETWSKAPLSDHGDCAAYRADDNYQCGDAIREGDPIQWRSSMFMPRKYSRLTLIVTDVRVQRLQDIEPDDAYEEGVKCDMSARTVIEHYRNLWNSLNAKRGYPWESNPWICALTFDVIKSNIDALPTSAAGM